MGKKISLDKKERFLIKRYLIWCYKTTKEDLDRIDRYFTQNIVDDFLLQEIASSKDFNTSSVGKEYKDLVKAFEEYKINKKNNADTKKFSDERKGKFHPKYQYLKNRFVAIERAIVHFLGKGELEKIFRMYEEEMTRRIWEAREYT